MDLETYLGSVIKFHALQLALFAKLAPSLKFRTANVSEYKVIPTQTSIISQIKAWPDSVYLLPLGSWIEPRQGIIELDNEIWQFTLHGTQEISFIHQRTGQDVTLTFSAQGDIGITEWGMRIFLQTTSTQQDNNQPEPEMTGHFATLVDQNLLTLIPPRPLFEERVFVLQFHRIEQARTKWEHGEKE